MQLHSHGLFSSPSNTLCAPEVITLINTRMLFWACSTNKPEGYRGECVPPGLYLSPPVSGTSQMLFDRFTHVKHTLVYLNKIQQISGLHGKIHVLVSWDVSKVWMPRKYILIFTSTILCVSGQFCAHCCGHLGCFQCLVNGS